MPAHGIACNNDRFRRLLSGPFAWRTFIAASRSTSIETDSNACTSEVFSRRQGEEERRRHLRHKFFEHAYGPRHMPVAEMYQRKIERAETPLRHDFYQTALAKQFRLHYWWEFSCAGSRDQGRGDTCVIVHADARLKHQL